MTKNVNQFIYELSEYINNNVVGRDDTHITACENSDVVLNRGHMIPVTIELPKNLEISEEFNGMSPIFYAEELMTEFPDSTAAAIGEIVNMQVNKMYGNMITVLKSQMDAARMSLDDYPKENIIVTAQPMPQADKMENGRTIAKTIPELGLTIFMKARICENPSNNTQAYFAPIKRKAGQKILETDWENAKANTMCGADPNIAFTDICPNVLICGELTDKNMFYNYFYLLSPEILKDFCEFFQMEKIYVVPDGPYHANFFAARTEKGHDMAIKKIRSFLSREKPKDPYGDFASIFEIDCGTFKVRKIADAASF